MSGILYASYGDNLDKDTMLKRCPEAKLIAKSWLHDYRIVFQGTSTNAHANVIPAKDESVPLAIYEISKSELDWLDLFMNILDSHYGRTIKEVEVDGEIRKVHIYIMRGQPYGVPHPDYMRKIDKGYEDLRFDFQILVAGTAESIHQSKKEKRR